MLHDLEKRVEVLSDALDGVKLSMRRLVLAEPWVEEALTSRRCRAGNESMMAPSGLPNRSASALEVPAAYEAFRWVRRAAVSS